MIWDKPWETSQYDMLQEQLGTKWNNIQPLKKNLAIFNNMDEP